MLTTKRNMSEFAEAPQPQQQPPEMEIAPRNPVDADTRPGVTERLEQLKQNPSLLESMITPAAPDQSNFFSFEEKRQNPRSEYSPEEAFYLDHGWKAYLSEYGDTGYRLEEIARAEKLDSQDIRGGIEDGTIKDPSAIRLYGQMKLDQTKLYWTRWEAEHLQDREDAQVLATAQITAAEAECEPLITATPAELTRYSVQQAEAAIQTADTIDDEEESEKRLLAASHWYEMAARLAEQRAKERKQTPATQQEA
jgi:hypothetical protein